MIHVTRSLWHCCSFYTVTVIYAAAAPAAAAAAAIAYDNEEEVLVEMFGQEWSLKPQVVMYNYMTLYY